LTRGQHPPTKQAKIKREKTKEECKPFLTISGTSERAIITLLQSGNYLQGITRGTDVNAHLFQISILDS
jgi:hypothetical protein